MIRITLITLVCAFSVSTAQASTECVTRKSGSYTITSCSSNKTSSSRCVSYMSGSVRKTYCR